MDRGALNGDGLGAREEADFSTAFDSFVARGEVFPLPSWYDFGVGPYWRLVTVHWEE